MTTTVTSPTASAPVLELPDVDAWTGWLAEHHASAREVWLRIGRKNAGSGLIAISDALDGALCYGWIDGQRKAYDDASFLQRYCPRTRRSTWSQVNVEKVEALVAAGRLQPPGRAAVEAAKADGRWDVAYVRQRDAEVPGDLVAALRRHPGAWTAFESWSRTEQYLAFLPVLRAASPLARERAVERAVTQVQAWSSPSGPRTA